MSIYVTGMSISIYDNFNNRVSIRKTESFDFKSATLIPEYNVQDSRIMGEAYKLGAAILTYLGKKSKDNFQKRFRKLHTLLNSFQVHSFETLKNRLESHMNTNSANQTQPVESFPEMQEIVDQRLGNY